MEWNTKGLGSLAGKKRQKQQARISHNWYCGEIISEALFYAQMGDIKSFDIPVLLPRPSLSIPSISLSLSGYHYYHYWANY